MIYHCNACRFNFERYGKVTQCPDCGKENIRYASKKEQEELRRYQEEYSREEDLPKAV